MIDAREWTTSNQSGRRQTGVAVFPQGESMADWLMSFFPLYLFFVGIMACKPDNGMPSEPIAPTTNIGLTDTTGNRLRIRVGQHTFTATLLSNATATAVKARLPLTISMRELNGNEKYGELKPNLPTNAVIPGTIQTGDLMLYGASTLVLFYDTFRTNYSYTRIGRIDNPSGLAAAVGTGSITVSFELANY